MDRLGTTPGGPAAVPAATAIPARQSRVRWTIFVLLLGIVTVNYIDRGSISVAFPLIAKEFGLSKQLTGVVLSAFFWAYAAMQLPAGWLIDRVRPRRVVAASCVGWGIAQGLTALAGGVGGLVVVRALLGVAEAPVMPAGGKLNAIWMPRRERGRGAVLLDGGAPLGAALGGIIISALIGLTGGWRMAFVIAGVGTVLFGLLAYWYIRDVPREHPRIGPAEVELIDTAHAEEDAANPPGRGRGLLSYLRFRSFWAMCVGWLGFNGVFYGLLTWGPLYLAETKHFDINKIGWSTLVIFGAGFVGELIGGYLADAWQRRGGHPNLVLRTLLGVAGVGVTAGLIGVTLVPNPLAAVLLLSAVLFFLRWVGLFWSVPSILGGRRDAGILGGAMNLAGNISGFVTPMAVGFIVGATGSYTGALLYFLAAGLLMTGAVLVLDYSRRLPA